jgi:hypothetical protein
MATIITVHGTGATGPAEGDAWWQKGSAFEKSIRGLVESTDGNLNFAPFVWDGRNSETSRFEAGQQLKARVLHCERSNDSYCLIGHSHGGSVICHSLLSAVSRGNKLANLSSWISVGTPFVETKRRALLFSRLGPLGVAAYFIYAYLLIAFLSFIISLVTKGAENRGFDAFMLIICASVLLLAFAGLHLLQPEKLRLAYRLPRVRRLIDSKRFSLWHKSDEAVRGLKLVREMRWSPFDSRFAVPSLSLASLFLLPIAMYLLSYTADYNRLAGHIHDWIDFRPTAQPDFFKRLARDSLFVISYPSLYIFELLDDLGMKSAHQLWHDRVLVGLVLSAGAVIGFGILWLTSVVAHQIVVWIARYVSHWLSFSLNIATQLQLRKLSLGGDTIGETAVSAGQDPSWTSRPSKPLPDPLSDEVVAISNAAAGEAVSKLRSALDTLTLSGRHHGIGEVIAEYLTWRELIHTTYFYVPRLNKLIAYAITQGDGFCPTDTFKHDPDYPIVATWYESLIGA